MQFTYCPHPACGAVAEIVDRFAFASTDGFIEHVKVQCLHRHLFMLPVDKLPSSVVDDNAPRLLASDLDG
jgi:hypothetical protein